MANFSPYCRLCVSDSQIFIKFFICLLISSLQSTLMIQKISEHMDQNDLPKLAFVPFQNNFKPKWEYQHKINPLSIKLPSIEAKRFGRIYQGVYPSVTTILSHTQSDETIKQLAYWGSKEVEKMGQENFDKMVQETMESGSNFHQVCVQYYSLDGDVIKC